MFQKDLPATRCPINRDAAYSFGTHFPARVLRVVDEEWRSEKLIMPEISIEPADLPPEEIDVQSNVEDEKSWKDLSVNEMISSATLLNGDSQENEFNIFGFNLDSRYFNHNTPLIETNRI